jgi:hypothetical protein
MVAINFNAANVKPREDAEVLPPGDYVAMIVNTEMRETKDGSGQYLWIEMDITQGEHQGRKIWDRLNLVNRNAKAVEIAERTLSSICHAVGKLNVQDSEEFHGCTVVAKVKVRPGQGEYGPSNEVANYRAAGAVVQMTRDTPAQVAPVQAVAQAAKPAPARAAAGATPPWRR